MNCQRDVIMVELSVPSGFELPLTKKKIRSKDVQIIKATVTDTCSCCECDKSLHTLLYNSYSDEYLANGRKINRIKAVRAICSLDVSLNVGLRDVKQIVEGIYKSHGSSDFREECKDMTLKQCIDMYTTGGPLR